MSYVPHTEAERNEMLARIGADAVEELFEAIPAEHRFPVLDLPRPSPRSRSWGSCATCPR